MWQKEERVKDFTLQEQGDYVEVLDDVVRTTRDHVVIDYDELLEKRRKHQLSKHEEYELQMVERLLH